MTLKSQFNKDAKIAIIGGGPAGTNMAYLLHKLGFKNLTIFEKSDHIGGKAYSVMHDNVIHEMGACYIPPSYDRIYKLMKEIGITETVDILPEFRDVFDEGKIHTKDYLPNALLKIWIAERRTIKSKIANILHNKLRWIPGISSLGTQIAKLLMSYDLISIIKKYNKFNNRIRKKHQYDIPNLAKLEHAKILSGNINKFLGQRASKMLQPIFFFLYTTMFYGYTNIASSYYGTYWVSKKYFELYIDLLTKRTSKTNGALLVSGFQSIWEKNAELSGAKIRLNSNIKKISRSEEDVTIDIEGEKSEKFDFMISAISAPDMLKLLDEPNKMEKKLFGHMDSSVGVTTLIEIDNPDERAGIYYWIHDFTDKGSDNVLITRTAASIIQNRFSRNQTIVAYQYYDTPEVFDEEKSFEGLKSSLEKSGLKIKKIITRKVWFYFYRFKSKDIRAGLPWKINQIQGKNRTLYIGASVCFESVNAVVNYNHYILNELGYKID